MKLVFSENNGEYLNKKVKKSITSTKLKQINENSKNKMQEKLIDKELK